MRHNTETDEEWLERVDSLFVGQLDSEEMALFQQLIVAGKARREYCGIAGLLGCATVRGVRAAPARGEGET